MWSSTDDEMPSTSKNESLSPRLELCASIASIEGVSNLPTTSSSSTMVAGRKDSEGNVELLFGNLEIMSQVFGWGHKWAKVVITKKLDVEVRHIGRHAWQELWGNLKMADLELTLVYMNPEGKRQQPQTIFTQSHGARSVFQIVLISHLMQDMTRSLIVNNLC
jgi:hypothetical protein